MPTLAEAHLDPAAGVAPRNRTRLTVDVSELGRNAAASGWPADVRQAWLGLLNQDPQARIDHHPDHVLIDGVRDVAAAISAAVFIVRENGEPVAVAALVAKRLPLTLVAGCRFPGAFLGYRLVGDDVLGRRDPETLEALLGEITRWLRRRGADVLYVDQLMDDSPLWENLRSCEARGFRLRHARDLQDRQLIHLPATAEEYWARYSSKTRNTFKRKDKKLGPVELTRITHADQVLEFLEAAHRISLKTWQTHRLGLRVSADEHSRELFAFLAGQQALRSYLLRQEGQPIAFCIGTQFHRTFRYEEVGYDQEFGPLSPGTVLLVRMLNDLFADDPPEWFDFGEGDADYKRMFANVQRRSGAVWLIAPGWRRTAVFAGARLCHRLKEAARAGVARLGLYRRLRQWHRQAPTEDAE